MTGKDQTAQIKNGTGNYLSWKTILITFLLFTVAAITIYSPSIQGDFVFDDVVMRILFNGVIYESTLFVQYWRDNS